MKRYCKICNKRLMEDEEEICEECLENIESDDMDDFASNILWSNDIPPNLDDF